MQEFSNYGLCFEKQGKIFKSLPTVAKYYAPENVSHGDND